MQPRIVVVNFTRMGDLIQSGPLLRAWKNSCPGSQLTVIVLPTFADAARRLPMVDRVIEFDVDRFVPCLDSQRGDLPRAYTLIQSFLADHELLPADKIINLSHTRQSAIMCGLLRGTHRSGLHMTSTGRVCAGEPWYWYLLSVIENRELNPFNLVDLYLRLAPARFHSKHLELMVTRSDDAEAVLVARDSGLRPDRPYVVLQLGASSPARQWPVERFAQVAKTLRAGGYQVALVGSKTEESLAKEFFRHGPLAAVDLVGRTTFGQLAAVLQRASALITNDTGTMHVAAAVGTQVIGLFVGPAAAKDTGPYGNGHIVIEPDTDCHPCGYQTQCASYQCHHAIPAGLVARIALAEDADKETVASDARGIRIWKTQICDRQGFELRALNSTEHDPMREAVAFYRDFWVALLDNYPREWITKSCDFNRTLFDSTALIALRRSHTLLYQCLNRLREYTSQDRSNKKLVESISSSFSNWQNDIRMVINEAPTVAPFARFLLTGAVLLRTDDPDSSLRDLSLLSSLLSRGLTLLANPEHVRRRALLDESLSA